MTSLANKEGRCVLITGGAGFIGRATADLLLSQGWRVVVLDNLDPQVHSDGRPDLPRGVRFVEGDVRNADLLLNLLHEVHAVLHLAARTGVGQSMYAVTEYVNTNCGGTAVLLDTLSRREHRVHKLVVASSRAIYGEGSYQCAHCGLVEPPFRSKKQLEAGQWEVTCVTCGELLEHRATVEEKRSSPGSVYAVTKRGQEELCLCMGGAYGIETLSLRYFNVYGAGQPLHNPYTGVIPAFSAQVLGRGVAEVYEDGQALRDFVHVSDVARANVLALGAEGVTGLALNVGASAPISILDAARAVTRVLGSREMPHVSGRFRVGDVRHCYADVSKAHNLLGYSARVTFDQGIEGMADWLRSSYRGDFSQDAAVELQSRGLMGRVER
jgi:dTDP-L-rhamnose 4-epimerase